MKEFFLASFVERAYSALGFLPSEVEREWTFEYGPMTSGRPQG